MTDARAALTAEWQAANPSTPEEIADFYHHAETMGADLAAWHATEQRQAWTEFIVRVARAAGVTSVLDVGCGRGDDLKALTAAGVTELQGVEPNEALADTTRQRASSAVIWAQMNDVFPNGRFDLTLCIDVLEHVPDPAALVEQIVARVPVDGYLIENTATHELTTPLHLQSNWGWLPDGQLRRHGFERVAAFDQLSVWRREREQTTQPQSLVFVAYRDLTIRTFESFLPLMRDPRWNIVTTSGDGLISRARSKAVSGWWRESPDDVFLMVDDDVTFTAQDCERVVALARERRGIACATYVVRGGDRPAHRLLPGTTVTFGGPPEPAEIKYAATGFMACHRDVIDALKATLPLCQPDQRGGSFWPFFAPYVDGHEYLSEDYAFCQRARDAGFGVWVLPDIRLGHVGRHEYTLTDLARKSGATDPERTAVRITGELPPWLLAMQQREREQRAAVAAGV